MRLQPERLTAERLTEVREAVHDLSYTPDDARALLAEVERLIAVVYPAPEQLTKIERQARYILEETQPPIYTEALAEHVLTMGAALREHDARLVAAGDRLAHGEDKCAAEVAAVREELATVREALGQAVAERDEMRARIDSAYEDCIDVAQVHGGIHRADALNLVTRIMSSLRGHETPSRVAYDRLHAELQERGEALAGWQRVAGQHQRGMFDAKADRDRLDAAVQRVRELCARGPGPSNEYQIWTVDVLAALDSERAREEGEPRA